MDKKYKFFFKDEKDFFYDIYDTVTKHHGTQAVSEFMGLTISTEYVLDMYVHGGTSECVYIPITYQYLNNLHKQSFSYIRLCQEPGKCAVQINDKVQI